MGEFEWSGRADGIEADAVLGPAWNRRRTSTRRTGDPEMSKKPHVLYILSDEHRGQAMGHSGDPNVKTPWMDHLAAGGASFPRAYANCPICTPSRGTIFSGRHAHAGPVAGF
ncbi:MAG TPA: hypothetical protein EYO90_10980, partial [Candidatus Latescibacteria bacterium]|nr:hypothetical protein [Candidatus Latescibacterota bacterium]